jgi:hypothetical protein
MKTTYKNPEGREFTVEQVQEKYHVPAHITASLFRYLNHQIPPGGFLTAVLRNDLRGAINLGDDEAVAGLPGLVRFIYNCVPASVTI